METVPAPREKEELRRTLAGRARKSPTTGTGTLRSALPGKKTKSVESKDAWMKVTSGSHSAKAGVKNASLEMIPGRTA